MGSVVSLSVCLLTIKIGCFLGSRIMGVYLGDAFPRNLQHPQQQNYVGCEVFLGIGRWYGSPVSPCRVWWDWDFLSPLSHLNSEMVLVLLDWGWLVVVRLHLASFLYY